VFETDEQKAKIIAAIKAHNSEEDEDKVGEEICMVMYRNMRRKTNAGNKCMMFGNGGGRSSTFEYFTNLGFNIEPYFDQPSRYTKKAFEINLETGEERALEIAEGH
jgi:hypothetical protein